MNPETESNDTPDLMADMRYSEIGLMALIIRCDNYSAVK